MLKARNDMVHFVMERAAIIYGGSDGVFNAACFSNALKKTTGVKHLMDGRLVSALMIGRPDVVSLSGGSHYQLQRG